MNGRLVAVLLCLLAIAVPVHAGQVGTLYSFSPKTVIESTKVNYNFAALLQGVNYIESDQIVDSTITGADIATNTISLDNLQQVISTVVVGTIVPYAGDTAPSGWKMCDGEEINRIEYSLLYAVVGTKFGVGDGATTFNIPDLRSRSIVGASSDIVAAGALGYDTRPARVLGDSGGVNTLTIAEMPSHSHSTIGQGGSTGVENPTLTRLDVTATTTGSTGGSRFDGNMQPFLVVNYIIYTGRR